MNPGEGALEDQGLDLVGVAARLGRHLQEIGLMVATAESCTGGLVAWALTETAGSSAWFERGVITYSNASKREALGVSEATLEAFGAVSQPVAREMALGALARSHAALSLAVTGIAGPGGAVPGKPVGTVCFGWALRLPDPTQDAPLLRVQTRVFPGDRAAVRQAAALHALQGAQALLEAGLRDRPLVG